MKNRIAGRSFLAEYCIGLSDTGKGQHGGLAVDSREDRETVQLEGLKRCQKYKGVESLKVLVRAKTRGLEACENKDGLQKEMALEEE